jgi:hypothetical protein
MNALRTLNTTKTGHADVATLARNGAIASPGLGS